MSKVLADTLQGRAAGNEAPDFPKGATVTGVVTTTDLKVGAAATVTGASTLTGWVSCGDTVALGDSKGIYLGADEDLSIYHDGSNSYISESGTGKLIVKGSAFSYQDVGGTSLIDAYQSRVDLSNATGGVKLATAPAGVVITGISTADDFYIGVGGTSVHTALGNAASTGKAIAMAMVFG
tara:strand:- start:1395 stop:1934 length:540 start_codon:yes stop_codon:yes gene_type:complete